MNELWPVILTVAVVVGVVIGILLLAVLVGGAAHDPQREDRRLARRHGSFR
jgi:uncharacterized membrane-anchored protein YhcB (DUF1043 family)